jgi:pyruvate dehydrogenase E2 component (dihydrolipoamide acetyltransferase)
VEVESPVSGVVRKLLVDEGVVVPVNSPMAIVGTADEKIEEPPVEKKTATKEKTLEVVTQEVVASPGVKPVSSTQVDSHILASPLARRMAQEKQVDLSTLKGTGPGGRIVRRDIDAALAGGSKLQSSINTPRLPTTDQTVSMSKLRQAIARRMTVATTTIPHFYVTHEYKMDTLINLRTQFNKIVPENEKLSVNDFIVKAVALTLRQFPNLNASLDGNAVIHHGQINIGVAVSVEGGLLTVVCRDADQKSLRLIAVEVKAMAARAREGKVKPDDIEGSTFSISNLGMYDVENFAAIINPPEAAILAVGSARELPIVDGGAVRSGWRMKATLSVDHRVSDGVEGAKFMQALAEYLEEPLRLVI